MGSIGPRPKRPDPPVDATGPHLPPCSVLPIHRVNAAQIESALGNKRPEHFVDRLSLADFYASLERAADVLSTVKGSQRGGVSDN